MVLGAVTQDRPRPQLSSNSRVVSAATFSEVGSDDVFFSPAHVSRRLPPFLVYRASFASGWGQNSPERWISDIDLVGYQIFIFLFLVCFCGRWCRWTGGFWTRGDLRKSRARPRRRRSSCSISPSSPSYLRKCSPTTRCARHGCFPVVFIVFCGTLTPNALCLVGTPFDGFWPGMGLAFW